jgi:uncharacterized phage protein (TIGR02220 family)
MPSQRLVVTVEEFSPQACKTELAIKLTAGAHAAGYILLEIAGLTELDQPDQAQEVLDFLNNMTGRKFRMTAGIKGLINARLKDYSQEEIQGVIAKKCTEWVGTKWEKYLRPQTLFNATKFDAYLNEPIPQPTTGNKNTDEALRIAEELRYELPPE